MAQLLFLLISFHLCLTNIESARILAVFPTPSISHQVVFRSLIEELVKRDHQVTVLTTDPAYRPGQAPPNLKEIDLHEISYKIWREELKKSAVGGKGDVLAQLNIMSRAAIKVFIEQLQNKEVRDIIEKKTGEYDLLLIEACVKPALIFSHIYKIPVIHVSSLGGLDYNFNIVGAPTHPLLYPNPLHQKLYNLTKWEKFQEVYNQMRYETFMQEIEKEYDEELRTLFGPNTPDIKELFNNVHMLFINVHPIWVENQPVPSSVVFIGGIHTKPSNKLPKVPKLTF